jgi:sugar phosphate isomerase/epimerase
MTTPMPQIAMNELTTYRWPFEEDVYYIKQAGYDGIGIWRPKLSDFGEERGIELLLDSQLVVSSLHWAGGFTGSDGRTHRDSIVDATDAIRLASELGTRTLFVHSGSRSGHTHRHARRLFVDALKETLPVAQAHDVQLVIEPMHKLCAGDWTCLSDLDEILDLIESLDSPQLALAIDSYHMLHDPSILDRISRLTDKIAIVQLSDALGEPHEEQDRRLLGEGMLPLGEAVGALKQGGYNGFYEVELFGQDMEWREYQHILQHSKQAADSLLNVYAGT